MADLHTPFTERFGHAGQTSYFLIFCPMAFDGRGATWLQDREQVNNPYFGSMMLGCGELEKTLPGKGDR